MISLFRRFHQRFHTAGNVQGIVKNGVGADRVGNVEAQIAVPVQFQIVPETAALVIRQPGGVQIVPFAALINGILEDEECFLLKVFAVGFGTGVVFFHQCQRLIFHHEPRRFVKMERHRVQCFGVGFGLAVDIHPVPDGVPEGFVGILFGLTEVQIEQLQFHDPVKIFAVFFQCFRQGLRFAHKKMFFLFCC